jgi:hypothetical protein
MVEERRLSCRGRHNGDLLLSVMARCEIDRVDRPTVSSSNKRIFIFAAEVPAAALSPADTILVM